MKKILLLMSILAAGLMVSSDANATLSSLSAAVPEPATMLLLGSGLIGLAALGRKRFLRRD